MLYLAVWYAVFGLYLVSLPILPKLFGGCTAAVQCGCGLFGDSDLAPASDWGFTVSHYIAAPVARGVFAALSAGPVATVWIATSASIAECGRRGQWALSIVSALLVAGFTTGWVVFLTSSVCGDSTEKALHAVGVYTSVVCAVPLYLMIATTATGADDDPGRRRRLGDHLEDATILLVVMAMLFLGLFVISALVHSQRDDVPSHLPWLFEVLGLMASFALPLHHITTFRRECTDTPRT